MPKQYKKVVDLWPWTWDNVLNESRSKGPSRALTKKVHIMNTIYANTVKKRINKLNPNIDLFIYAVLIPRFEKTVANDILVKQSTIKDWFTEALLDLDEYTLFFVWKQLELRGFIIDLEERVSDNNNQLLYFRISLPVDV